MVVVLVAAAHVEAAHMGAAVAVGFLAVVEVVRVSQVQVQAADGLAVQVQVSQVQVIQVQVPAVDGLVAQVRGNQVQTRGLVAQANRTPTPIRIHPVHRSAGRIHRHPRTNTLPQTHTRAVRTLAVATAI